MRVLFVTWDSGATDYLSSLFFPTFAALAERGVHVHTLQGTYGGDGDLARVRADAAARGLDYRALRVPAEGRRRQMPSFMRRFAREIVTVANAVDADVVMPRAIVPAAACVLARPGLKGRRLIWDADGLPADERVDFAGWSRRDPRYLGMRGVEWAMLRAADRTMVRTRAAAGILTRRAGPLFNAERLLVVPNGRNSALYAPDSSLRGELRAENGILADAPVLISVGSIGPQYCPAWQADITAALLRRNEHAHAIFLTAQYAKMCALLSERGVHLSRVIARRVPAAEVPRWLAMADVGLALREPAFSQQAVCPLKVGEYLLSGLPVIATCGVGDLDTQLQNAPGYTITRGDSLDAASIVDWIASVSPLQDDVRARCRAMGLRDFSLAAAVDGYCRLLTA